LDWEAVKIRNKKITSSNAVGGLLKKRCSSDLVRKWKLGGLFA
jgi:hypothetical protein